MQVLIYVQNGLKKGRKFGLFKPAETLLLSLMCGTNRQKWISSCVTLAELKKAVIFKNML